MTPSPIIPTDEPDEAAIAQHVDALESAMKSDDVLQSKLQLQVKEMRTPYTMPPWAIISTNPYKPAGVNVVKMTGWQHGASWDIVKAKHEAKTWVGDDYASTIDPVIVDLEPTSAKQADERFANMKSLMPRASLIALCGLFYPRNAVNRATHWKGAYPTYERVDQNVVVFWHRYVEGPLAFTAIDAAAIWDMLVECFRHGRTPVFVNHTEQWYAEPGYAPQLRAYIDTRCSVNGTTVTAECRREDDYIISMMRAAYEGTAQPAPFVPIVIPPVIPPPVPPVVVPPPTGLVTNVPKVGGWFDLPNIEHAIIADQTLVDVPTGIKVNNDRTIKSIAVANTSVQSNAYCLYIGGNVEEYSLSHSTFICTGTGGNSYCERGQARITNITDCTFNNEAGQNACRRQYGVFGGVIEDSEFIGGPHWLGSGTVTDDDDQQPYENVTYRRCAFKLTRDAHLFELYSMFRNNTFEDCEFELVTGDLASVWYGVSGNVFRRCAIRKSEQAWRPLLISDFTKDHAPMQAGQGIIVEN